MTPDRSAEPAVHGTIKPPPSSGVTGRPAITGYDLQYKKSNETTWTAGLQGITTTSDSITGLDPSTS